MSLRILVFLLLTAAAFAKDPLLRRAWFGAQLAPASAEQLAGSTDRKFDTGVALPNVFPNSSAADAGIMSGDILLTANGMPLGGPQDVGPLLKAQGAGADIVFEVLRTDKIMSKIVRLKEAPRETSDEFEIIYDAAEIDGYLRRIILTKPKGNGPFPVVILMGGLGCYSVDALPSQPFAYRDILYNFTRNGFATVRIEKTGMGDSQGEPCAQQSFFDETNGLTVGIKSLDRFKWIDKSRMIYFGHSMGGLTSPVVYQDIPCAGIVAVATSGIDWKEYEMENNRRQLVLAGIPYDSIEVLLDRKYTAMHKLFVEHKNPDEILAQDSSLAEDIAYPAHHTFMQEVADLSLADYWKHVDTPVLFVCGTADFVVAQEEHTYARDIVNAFHPGRAEYAAIEGMDHGFNNPSTKEIAFAGMPFTTLHPDFFPTVLEFCQRAIQK